MSEVTQADQTNMQIMEQREAMRLAIAALNELRYSSSTFIAHQKFTLAINALREALGETK